MGRGLLRGALELYRKRGFDQTTTAEIAAKAGVTERTFFRHFPDKREVLFDGEALLKSTLVQAVAAAPKKLGSWETLFWAFRSVEQLFIENRPFSEPRQRVIASSAALRERELAKVGSLAAALAVELQKRGVVDTRAYNFDTLVQNALTTESIQSERTVIQPRTIGIAVDAKF